MLAFDPHLDVLGGVPPPEAVLLLLEEDGDSLADPAGQPASLHSLGEFRAPVGAACLFRVGELARHGRRRGPLAAGVGEDMHLGKGAALEEGQCLLKFFLRLAGEADDEIGGEGGAVEVGAEQLDGFQEALRRILPLHPGQDRVAAALQGEVKVGAEVGQGR